MPPVDARDWSPPWWSASSRTSGLPPTTVAPTSDRSRIVDPRCFWPSTKQPGKKVHYVITDDNLISEYKHGMRFGPAMLRALQPASPPLMPAEGL